MSFNRFKNSKLVYYLCVNLKYVFYEIICKLKIKNLGRWLLKIMLREVLSSKFLFNLIFV